MDHDSTTPCQIRQPYTTCKQAAFMPERLITTNAPAARTVAHHRVDPFTRSTTRKSSIIKRVITLRPTTSCMLRYFLLQCKCTRVRND